eukprot:Tamp_10577.p1 GENE.Tamp_10577~~Tamp_10577.p1  ORF type:complete len:572 (-),score=93.23 Tamp_10577:141-1856(-)
MFTDFTDMVDARAGSGMRRRGHSVDRHATSHDGEKEKTGTQKVMRLQAYAMVALGLLATVAIFLPSEYKGGETQAGQGGALMESEDAIWNATVAEIATFRKTGRLPTFGLTEGRYYYMNTKMKSNAALRLKQLCKYDCTNNTKPPLELLRPGRLSTTPSLSERAQCFLWYAAQIWTRPMGGKKGLLLARIGAGVDDKAFLVHALEAYQTENKCKAWNVAPPTIELNVTAKCEAFFQDNRKWAPTPETLWFMKAADGSTGRHISLMRRMDIERSSAAGQAACPVPGGIASLEVPNVLLMEGRKFDNRVFVLVVSFDPLIILFHKGHLRRSVFKYADPFSEKELTLNTSFYNDRQFEDRLKHATTKFSKPSQDTPNEARPPPVVYAGGQKPEENIDLARHITNPRFGLAHTNDSSAIIQPLDKLRIELLATLGPDPEKGTEAWKKLQTSVRNTALQITYAIKQKFFGRHYHTRWGFMWLAMDVVYDTDMRAYVVDINSGPSFYHEHKWPDWFLKERSALTREAMDYIQEAGFLKATKHTSSTPLTPPSEWEILFHEHRGGVQRAGVIAPGECV